jgi:hypothetical protein
MTRHTQTEEVVREALAELRSVGGNVTDCIKLCRDMKVNPARFGFRV